MFPLMSRVAPEQVGLQREDSPGQCLRAYLLDVAERMGGGCGQGQRVSCVGDLTLLRPWMVDEVNLRLDEDEQHDELVFDNPDLFRNSLLTSQNKL